MLDDFCPCATIIMSCALYSLSLSKYKAILYILVKLVSDIVWVGNDMNVNRRNH